MTRHATMVLLHGAGTGAWIWERILGGLSLPALAPEVREFNCATPDSCAASLVSELDRKGVDSAILVLHSLAGVLAPGLAARMDARLRRIVYLAAVIPPNKGSYIDALPLATRIVLRLLFTFNTSGLKPSRQMIRRQLCNDLGPEDMEMVISRYSAEKPGLFLSPTGRSMPHGGATYIKLSKDRTLLPPRQDSMIRRIDSPRVREIDAGHLAMLSAPDALIEILEGEAKLIVR